MSDDRVTFLRAIADQPADRTARLVFADFLDETGGAEDAIRAEFIRAQVEAETVHPNSARAAELDSRARDLFARHWLDWLAPVCAAVGLPIPYRPTSGVRGWLARRLTAPPPKLGHPYARGWGFGIDVDAPPNALRAIRFAGGFPEALALLGQPSLAADWLRKWRDAAPLGRLELNGAVGRDWRALDGPHLSGLHALELKHSTSTLLDPVGRSPHLTQLEELRLAPDRSNLAWGGQQYHALALSPLTARVRKLIVEFGTGAEARELLNVPFPNLNALEVRAPRPRPEWVNETAVAAGVAELVSSVHLNELEELTFDATTSGAMWVSPWPHLPRLRRLELVLTSPLVDPPRFFPSERLFPALTDLTVSSSRAEWIDALASWPVTARLCHLRIAGRVRPTDAMIEALLRLESALDERRVETVRFTPTVSSARVRAAFMARFGDRARFG